MLYLNQYIKIRAAETLMVEILQIRDAVETSHVIGDVSVDVRLPTAQNTTGCCTMQDEIAILRVDFG